MWYLIPHAAVRLDTGRPKPVCFRHSLGLGFLFTKAGYQAALEYNRRPKVRCCRYCLYCSCSVCQSSLRLQLQEC